MCFFDNVHRVILANSLFGVVTKTLPARAGPRTCRWSPTWTVSRPSMESRSRTAITVWRRMTRAVRARSTAASVSLTRAMATTSPGRHSLRDRSRSSTSVPSGPGMGSPCGQVAGMSQKGINALLELLRNDVFQLLRLGVHLVPGVAHRLCQIQFQQPMMPDHFQGDLFPIGERRSAMIRGIGNQVELRQMLEHLGHGGGRGPGPLGQGRGGNGFGLRLQLVDRLDVIFHGGGVHIASR